jgi:hypothetical protein
MQQQQETVVSSGIPQRASELAFHNAAGFIRSKKVVVKVNVP